MTVDLTPIATNINRLAAALTVAVCFTSLVGRWSCPFSKWIKQATSASRRFTEPARTPSRQVVLFWTPPCLVYVLGRSGQQRLGPAPGLRMRTASTVLSLTLFEKTRPYAGMHVRRKPHKSRIRAHRRTMPRQELVEELTSSGSFAFRKPQSNASRLSPHRAGCASSLSLARAKTRPTNTDKQRSMAPRGRDGRRRVAARVRGVKRTATPIKFARSTA